MKFFFEHDYDFNFKGDRTDAFVHLIISFLMYSVTIAIMSGLFSYNLTSDWSRALNGRLTIEIQSNVGGLEDKITTNQKNEIVKVVGAVDGIKSIKKLNEAEILKILEPWLSGTAIPDDFPFPVIFDVETENDVKIDLLALTEKIAKIVPGVRIHDHYSWYIPLLKTGKWLLGFAVLLSGFIFMTVCFTIIFITKKTLRFHQNIVKILQLIGASNQYIAMQFKKYYFSIGCKAAVISFMISLFTVIFMKLAFSSGFMIDLTTIYYLLISIIIPFITIILIMVTSKKTVLFFLTNDKWVN